MEEEHWGLEVVCSELKLLWDTQVEVSSRQLDVHLELSREELSREGWPGDMEKRITGMCVG